MKPATASLVFLILFIPLLPLPCFSALITISPESNGVYTFQGEGLNNITVLDISLDYDPATLSSPRISPSILAARSTLETVADSPGSLRLTLTRQAGSITGSGQMLQVTFNADGQSPGAITGLSVQMTDARGERTSAETRIDEPVNPDGSPKESPNNGLSTTLPSSDSSADAAPGRSGSQHGRGAHTGSAIPTVGRSMALQAVPGVLDHVRVLGDGKDLDGLLALFARGAPPGLRQDPAVCLSDGKTRIRLTVSAVTSEQRDPYFVLSGAHFLSLRNSGGRSWTVEALPDMGVYQASLMVVSDAGSTVYPLTVAPPSPVDGTLTNVPKKKQAKALAAALRGMLFPGSSGLPEHVRRYILAANLLAAKNAIHASARR